MYSKVLEIDMLLMVISTTIPTYQSNIDRILLEQDKPNSVNTTSLTDNNPFTKMLKGQGYNYITNLSQFASGVGNNVLYGAYSNPSDVNGKMGFYLKESYYW